MLRQLPAKNHPDLLVGFENSDDAGVFALSETQALVQTIDFFTPIVDDPYAYGLIAAANSLSDVYAMGGRPITAMNIACFDPEAAPPETWAEVLRGMFDKCKEAGAAVVGGHSVKDSEPKFGLSVTGLVNPQTMFVNTKARPGDRIYLSKPLGTGIVSTAIKAGAASGDQVAEATHTMATLNREASEMGLRSSVQCATDITGFGLAGHLFNVARASGVSIELDYRTFPLLEGVVALIEQAHTTGGAAKNAQYLGDAFLVSPLVPDWVRDLVFDPQTSGGLALFHPNELAGLPCIGVVKEGSPSITVF